MINGVNVTGQTASTFTSSTLANGNIITVVMTSNDPCVSPANATSNSIGITTTTVAPSVSISASTTSICVGNPVTFTATPANGGSAPTYQWMINGISVVGQTASVFTTSTLANGNAVTVVMTSNDPCANPATAISNSIGITTTSVVPSVSITSTTTSICSGGSVTFTATPGNGGSNPVYQWMINGVNVAGQTASTFTTSSLSNGNTVTVVMTSNDPCASAANTTSNTISITTTIVTPSVSITSTTTSICSGGSVTFTATPTNGGAGPTYQWMINGVNVAGQTASTFTTTSLSSGSAVSVMMTSNDPCANPVAPVQSQSITITSGAPVLMITNPPAVCAPASVDLTAALVTAGSQAGLVFSYWLDANATTPLTNPNAVMNAGTYYIKVQDAGGCFITKPVNVSIEQKINGIRYPDVTAAANSPLQLNARSPGTGYLYSWSPPTGLNLSNIKDPVFINNTGLEYLIRITSPAGCITVDTQLVKMTPVVQFQTPDIFVPKAWSPNGDGHNDLLFPFLVNITELKYFRIYDRWGQKVFETNSNGKGWDGVYNGKQQLSDVYTWVIEAVGVDGKTIRRSGNAVLLR
jgi:gliding motility-associated-like protein